VRSRTIMLLAVFMGVWALAAAPASATEPSSASMSPRTLPVTKPGYTSPFDFSGLHNSLDFAQSYNLAGKAQEQRGWKGWLFCAAAGVAAGWAFTPVVGALVGTACRVVATPTPAYMQYYPSGGGGYYSSSGGGGGGSCNTCLEEQASSSDGDWYHYDYYYDAAEDGYYTEAYSDTYVEQ
jgi:hypothetical protein